MGNRINNDKKHYWYKAFLFGLFFSAAFFIPYIVIGHGYFLYYGDFNVQQVPFYQMIHDQLRAGNFQWSNTTDLGSSIVGSYSFYMLGSPFFWITLPFPSKAVPYLMGPLLILKFACASLTGYIYLRRYVRNKDLAVLGGLLYAFSGFSVYNVFFNHFHEAIITFPLLLAAIDEYMDNHRRGVVALAVFISCLVNYYFFVAMVAFVIIYWFLRIYLGSYKLAPKDFLPLAFEVLLGFAGTFILLLPTIYFVTQNPRLDDAPQGFDALLYYNEQRYLHIISSMFFPPDIPARPNFTPDSNAKWASVAAWLPMYGMTGVIAFLQSKSKSWLKKLLPFLFICTLIPILNAIFQMFVMSYYARWFFMLTLMMSLATIISIENAETRWQPAIRLSLVITTFIAICIGFMPNGEEEDSDKLFAGLGLEEYPERFWIYVAIAMLSLAVVTLICRAYTKNRRSFFVKAVSCFGVIAVIYSGYIIGLGKSHSYDVDNFIIPYVLNNGEDLELSREELNNCRSDFFDTMDNVGMFWQIPNIQAFQSVVPGSIYTFYPSVGVTRDVGSRPETDYYALRSLLSVKYLFDYTGDDNDFQKEDGKTKMPRYKLVGESNGFKIFENKNYIPYGFWYDKYITEDQYYDCDESLRSLVLMKAMVLSDENAKKLGGLMEHMDEPLDETFDVPTYNADCSTLKKHTCQSFNFGKDRFTAQITLPAGSDKLVFFSIPYEAGWSAEINGEPAEIIPVNIGFMAVRAKAGTLSNITFKYRTPGLYEGAAVTLVCIILYFVYIAVSAKYGKLKPRMRLKKTYRVAAVGSGEEIGRKYRELRLGSEPMKRKRVAPDVTKDDEENNIINDGDSTGNAAAENTENTDIADTQQNTDTADESTQAEQKPAEDDGGE